jgi:hypothetical protein
MIQFIEIGGDHLDSMMCLPEFQSSPANTNTVNSTPNTPVAANTVDILRRYVTSGLDLFSVLSFLQSIFLDRLLSCSKQRKQFIS